MTAHFPVGRERPLALMPSEAVRPRIGRVLQHLQRALVSQVSPLQLAVPHAALASLGEAKLVGDEPLHHRVGAAASLELPEDQCNGATYLLIRIHNDLPLWAVAKSHRQGNPQFTPLGLVQLAALEAGAQEVQFGLRHGALEAEQ